MENATLANNCAVGGNGGSGNAFGFGQGGSPNGGNKFNSGGFGGGGGGGSFSSRLGSQFGGGLGGNGSGSNGGGGGAGLGGAVFNDNGTATIINSTFSGNSAQGGNGGDNLGFGTAGDGGGGFGGGLFSLNSSVTITNSTFANNPAAGGNGGGNAAIPGATGAAQGGGIYVLGFTIASTLTMNNSIVALTPNSVPDFVAGAASGGTVNTVGTGNIIQTDAGFGGSFTAADPMLGALANNGGTTQTHALLAGSPAINAGSNALAVDADGQPLTTDQRGTGFSRIISGTTDIGAFEFLPPDTTPPVITPVVIGTLGTNGWYRSDINVSWVVTDAESTVSNQTGCDAQTVSTDTSGVTFTCSATSAGGTSMQSVTVKRDATNPTIAFVSRTPAANGAGWNNTNVTVNWNCTDATSGAVNPTASQTVSTEGLNQSAAGTCTDNAGNTASNTQTGISIDKTAPTLAPTVSPNPVLLGGTATATPNATDALSGIASQSCAATNTTTVGNKTVACTATDVAGNTANANANYRVVYNFAGFFQPVDNLPVINVATAGSSIPVKFSLSGNQGLAIFAAGFPSSGVIPCDGGTTSTIEETVTAGASTLTYDAATGQYKYVWATNRAWRGTCRQLQVRFIDGNTYVANFSFR